MCHAPGYSFSYDNPLYWAPAITVLWTAGIKIQNKSLGITVLINDPSRAFQIDGWLGLLVSGPQDKRA